MVAKLRADGAEGLELLGTTLKALRLGQRDAAAARASALTALGLRPLGLGEPVRAGASISLLPPTGGAAEYEALLDGVVADDAGAADSAVYVSVEGAPPVYVERSELAVWLDVGAADAPGGPSGGADPWAWLGSPSLAPAAASNGASTTGGGKKKKRKR